MSETKRIVKSILFIGSIFLLNACVVVVKNDPNYRPTSPSATRTASAYQYWYYYPENRVYYHITERYYYFPVGNSWQKARHLPKGWVLNNEGRVRLRLAGEPYLKHANHQREYPSKKVVDNDNPRNNAKDKTFPRRNWAWGQQDHQEHPGSNGQQNRPTDTRGYAVSEEVHQRQQPPGHVKSEDKLNREHGNSANAPGRIAKEQENSRARPEHAQGKPEKDKQNNGRGKEIANQSHGGGKSQAQNSPVDKSQGNGQAHENQKNSRPDHGNNRQQSQQVNNQHGKSNKASTEQAMKNDNPKKNQQVKSEKQPDHKPEHRKTATQDKSVASKAADSTAKNHSQSPSKHQDSKGRQEKFKSHDINQANLAEEADQRSKIPVNQQPVDEKSQQAKNKGGSKAQAKLSGNNGKAEQKSKAASADESPAHTDGDTEVANNSGDDINKKGKGKGR